MLTLNEITSMLGKLSNWTLDGSSIAKQFDFSSFKDAITFVNNVAEIAEKNNHHPEILISYNMVRLTLTTHSAKSLTETDFKVAEQIDKISPI